MADTAVSATAVETELTLGAQGLGRRVQALPSEAKDTDATHTTQFHSARSTASAYTSTENFELKTIVLGTGNMLSRQRNVLVHNHSGPAVSKRKSPGVREWGGRG